MERAIPQGCLPGWEILEEVGGRWGRANGESANPLEVVKRVCRGCWVSLVWPTDTIVPADVTFDVCS